MHDRAAEGDDGPPKRVEGPKGIRSMLNASETSLRADVRSGNTPRDPREREEEQELEGFIL